MFEVTFAVLTSGKSEAHKECFTSQSAFQTFRKSHGHCGVHGAKLAAPF